MSGSRLPNTSSTPTDSKANASGGWSQLREWDRLETQQIREFQKNREDESLFLMGWKKFLSNPFPYLAAPLAGYCIFAGLNALQNGHTYVAMRYLEGRIMAQGLGIVSIFLGAVYYNRKEKFSMQSDQPYGPYAAGYGKVHPGSIFTKFVQEITESPTETFKREMNQS